MYPTDRRYSKEHEWVAVDGDAARIGITHGYLCLLTQGRRAPSRAVAERIVAVLPLQPTAAELLLDEAVDRPRYPGRVLDGTLTRR